MAILSDLKSRLFGIARAARLKQRKLKRKAAERRCQGNRVPAIGFPRCPTSGGDNLDMIHRVLLGCLVAVTTFADTGPEPPCGSESSGTALTWGATGHRRLAQD